MPKRIAPKLKDTAFIVRDNSPDFFFVKSVIFEIKIASVITTISSSKIIKNINVDFIKYVLKKSTIKLSKGLVSRLHKKTA